MYKINKGLISEILWNFHFSERAQGRKVKSEREYTGKKMENIRNMKFTKGETLITNKYRQICHIYK